MQLGAINRSLVRDQVADVIRDLLLSGGLAAGDPLREQDLAQRLGVSRNPIREALLGLCGEGLLTSQGPQRGYRVAMLSDQEVDDLYSLRAVLEGFAAERCALTRTPDDLEFLTETAKQIDEAYRAGDFPETVKCDMAFHQRIVEASGHQLLEKVWIAIRNRIMLASNSTLRTMYLDVPGLGGAHLKIVEAIRSRDPQASSEVCLKHISDYFTRYKARSKSEDSDIANDLPGHRNSSVSRT